MFFKSICSVLLLLREGGRKLWKGFNLLLGGSCAVNTPATSSLGRCQGFLQPRLCEEGEVRTGPHRCFLSVPFTSQPDAKRINSGSFRITTSRLCPKLELVILLTVMHDATLCCGSTTSEITTQNNTKQRNRLIIKGWNMRQLTQMEKVSKCLTKLTSVEKYCWNFGVNVGHFTRKF